MSGRDWASLLKKESEASEIPPPSEASFSLFELVNDKWKSIKDVSVNDLIDGPYVAKINDCYFAGNELVSQKLKDKKIDWAFKLIDSMTSALCAGGLSITEIREMSFRLMMASYLAIQVFGGRFLTSSTNSKTTAPCRSTQISIPT